jgi:7,8-dihydropterin-6-yl-methyl-4-(beta-D-ribofuranosyl)aminobenzene 5'-phosphate synthase
MKLTVLTENLAGGHFLAEHGLSYLIEYDGKTILFDTGHSDVFIKNAAKLGIDLQEKVDLVILSHGHWDHGDGLRFLKDKPLLAHPAAFMKRFRKNGGSPVGLSLSKEDILTKFDLTTSATPVIITEHMIFLAEVLRLNGFEAQTTAFVDENGADDFVPDDSALAIIKDEKLVIVSGCAHSGICNICEYAKHVSGIKTIQAVIGGFHLKQNNAQTQRTIEYFQKEKVRHLYPSHCTELPALAAFYEAFAIGEVRTGMVIG